MARLLTGRPVNLCSLPLRRVKPLGWPFGPPAG
jgi:hypothetical protein